MRYNLNITKISNNLEAMLAGVTPELIGGELDWGMDVGFEKLN